MNDLKYCILHFDQMTEQTMMEIILKLLKEKQTLPVLYEEQVQKNITKIFLVRVYTGAELLSRISIRMWNSKLDKDMINAIEQHIKEPYTLVYCQKPILTIVLLAEFLMKLS